MNLHFEMNMLNFLLLWIILFDSINANDYCEKQQSMLHIGCDQNKFGHNKDCLDIKEIDMTPEDKSHILQNANKMRNDVAGGNVLQLEGAQKMKELIWDQELSDLATLYVKLCKREDENICHSTEKYPHGGQIVSTYISAREINSSTVIDNIFDDIFKSKDLYDVNRINSYNNQNTTKISDKFATLMQDENDAIGCKMISYSTNTTKYIYMIACNCGVGNIVNEPVFKIGKPSTACNNTRSPGKYWGRSTDYPNLCKEFDESDGSFLRTICYSIISLASVVSVYLVVKLWRYCSKRGSYNINENLNPDIKMMESEENIKILEIENASV